MQYKMTYPEFLKSEIKHDLACNSLTQAIEARDNSEEIKSLTLNLYYLSGYIIECAIKYGIYQSKAEHCIQSIMNICQQQGKPFQSKMFKHKYSLYSDFLESSLSGIVLIHEKSTVEPCVITLYNQWDAEIRYYYDDMPTELKGIISYSNVKQFNAYAKLILEDIKNKSLGR